MINPPKTIRQALKYKYGPPYDERNYDIHDCAYEVFGDWGSHQCGRSIKKGGHGPGKLYCKQHAKMAIERI